MTAKRSYSRNPRPILIWLATLIAISPGSAARAHLAQDDWGERFNTINAKLVVKETGRFRSNGRTIVAYSLFASGLPLDAHYTLWTRQLGSDPQPAADAFLNNEGKAVSKLAEPERGMAEDPINLKVLAGRGEPKQFGLISKDGRFRAFAQVVPFPIESVDGPCHLTALMTGPNYIGVSIRITGFKPAEDLLVDTRPDHEVEQRKGKSTSQGAYESLLFPFVKGKRSGSVRFSVTANSCKVGIEFGWGEDSYQLQ